MHPITFDPAKNAANLAKHGVALATAQELDWDTAICWPDTRRDYGEARMAGIGYIGQRLYSVVYIDRADSRRVISLRKANLREEKRYAEA